MSAVFLYLLTLIPFYTYGFKNISFDQSMGGILEKTSKGRQRPEMVSLLRQLYQKNNLSKVIINKREKIPQKIHQIWLGKKPLPATYHTIKESWIAHNPGWQYRLWTDQDIAQLKLINQTFFDNATDPVEKANIVRYEILLQEGGLYADIDFQCLKSFKILHYAYNFYTGIEPLDGGFFVNNALIGCTPNHPIIRHCIDTIKNDMHKPTRLERNGVGHFSKAFFESAQKAAGVTIALPASFFYPIPVGYKNGTPLTKYIKPESFAVHYWGSMNKEFYSKTFKVLNNKKKVEL